MHTFPIDTDLNEVSTLKVLSDANNKIGELKGMMNLLPNPKIITANGTELKPRNNPQPINLLSVLSVGVRLGPLQPSV